MTHYLMTTSASRDVHLFVLQVEPVRTVAEETRAEGNVGGHIYLKYFTAGCNPLGLVAIVLLSIIAEVCSD